MATGAVRADGYTRAVNTLKVFLPLSALALLSTLFFFSGEVDPRQSIPYAELNVDALVEAQRVSAPYFAGVTEGGDAVTLTGTAAIPDRDDPDRLTVENIDARFVTPEDLVVSASAPRARIDTGTNVAELQMGALVTTSDGMRMESDTLIADMGTSDLIAPTPIVTEGPMGRITAQSMRMERPGPGRPHRIVFQGAVKLVYVEDSE